MQPAQTRLSFKIWLMLSRRTAAGHRKQRTGKTWVRELFLTVPPVAWVSAPLGIEFLSLFLSFFLSFFLPPKALWPQQMQNNILFIHRKSLVWIKMTARFQWAFLQLYAVNNYEFIKYLLTQQQLQNQSGLYWLFIIIYPTKRESIKKSQRLLSYTTGNLSQFYS